MDRNSLIELCTTKDCAELKKLILENPEAPLLIFAGEDAWHDEYAYESCAAGRASLQKLTLYEDSRGRSEWLDEEDYTERLADDLFESGEYFDMSEKEFDTMIENKVANTEFIKAIVVYVG